MATAKLYDAIVKATGEPIKVYKLADGTYFDYDNMGGHQPQSAPKAGKKNFKKHELTGVPQE